MAETELIPSNTVITAGGTTIAIESCYIPSDLQAIGVLLAFVSQIVGPPQGGENIDTVNFIEGEGGITMSIDR